MNKQFQGSKLAAILLFCSAALAFPSPIFASNTQAVADGLRNYILSNIKIWVVDLLIPVLTVVGLVFFVVQVFGLVKIKKHGDPGGEFGVKAGFAFVTLIVSIGLGTVWGLFASYLR